MCWKLGGDLEKAMLGPGVLEKSPGAGCLLISRWFGLQEVPSWSQLPACAALLPREAGECPALGFGDNPKEPRASGTLREGAISNLGEPSL